MGDSLHPNESCKSYYTTGREPAVKPSFPKEASSRLQKSFTMNALSLVTAPSCGLKCQEVQQAQMLLFELEHRSIKCLNKSSLHGLNQIPPVQSLPHEAVLGLAHNSWAEADFKRKMKALNDMK